ncbi:MAG: dTMP kinase [Eubacteriales bacterium]
MRGKFIVLEGIDCSGKSTQQNYLGESLENFGYSVVYTREPGGTPLGEAVRKVLLDRKFAGMDSRAEALLYAAARAEHVFKVIAPALEAGKVVLCDRFLDSSLAYQGYGRGIDLSLIKEINGPAIGETLPDLVLVLDIPLEMGRLRLGRSGQGKDRIELEKMEFHRRVRDGYLKLAAGRAGRYRVIDAAGPPEEVRDAILAAALEVLHGLPGRVKER